MDGGGRPRLFRDACVVIGLFGVLALTVADCSGRPRTADDGGGPARPPSASASATRPTSIAVIGDSYSSGSREGGTGARGWPRILAGRLHAGLTLEAVSGTGWVNPGDRGQTFMRQARALAAAGQRPDLVIVFGSRNDAPFPGDRVRAAATWALAYLERTQPQARIVVVGPCWPVQFPPGAHVADLSPAVRAASEAGGVSFVDPMGDEPWFDERNGELIGTDELHPNDAGHRYLALRILAALRQQEIVPAA